MRSRGQTRPLLVSKVVVPRRGQCPPRAASAAGQSEMMSDGVLRPTFMGAEVQIEARITVRELICLSERNQVINRMYEQSQVIIPPRVCDLRRLEACKLSDRRRQFVFRWHRSPLHANRNNGDITPNSRLNFLPYPIFRQIQTSLPAWIFCR